jgi:GT2 family glycosyltransferase
MIYIVIPVFNRRKFTQDCLLSLRNQKLKAFKTIVVDDGSIDGTQEMIREEFPEVILLETTGDLFWTATTNLGIKYALEQGADYVMTLNNDTYATPDFVEKMDHWSRKHPRALFGAFALDADSKKPLYAGEVMDWKLMRSKSWLQILKKEEFKGVYKVSHFPGRGLLIPKSCFNDIGMFDEVVFPHYYADYDFTHKAKRYGYEIYCNHDAKLFIYPDVSGDKENRKKKSARNYFNHLFDRKGGGNLRNFTVYVFRNCPPMNIPIYWSIGIMRRLFGYWIK